MITVTCVFVLGALSLSLMVGKAFFQSTLFIFCDGVGTGGEGIGQEGSRALLKKDNEKAKM